MEKIKWREVGLVCFFIEDRNLDEISDFYLSLLGDIGGDYCYTSSIKWIYMEDGDYCVETQNSIYHLNLSEDSVKRAEQEELIKFVKSYIDGDISSEEFLKSSRVTAKRLPKYGYVVR